MLKKKVAVFISRVFDPSWESVAVLYLLARLSSSDWKTLFLASVFFVFILPFTFFLFLLKTKRIEDWDITKREQRYLLFSFAFFAILAFLTFVYFYFPQAVFMFYLKAIIPLFLFFIITFFWKISGHAFVNSFFILLISLYINNLVILTLGILVLVLMGWSRIILKKHNLKQIIAGILLPLLSFLLYFFKLVFKY